MSTYHTAGGGTYYLGSSIGSTDTTILLSSFLEPVSGTPYTMALLNTSIAYGTFGPGTSSSEFISFTSITQNANGTATLTGVTRGLAKKYPFTSSATFKLPHSGQSIFILSDVPQVFEKYPAKENDETITGLWTFSQFPITPSNVPATTTTLGLVKTSVAPASAASPIAVETTDSRVPVGYAVSATGNDTYVINPTPAETAYVIGKEYSFKADVPNTGACSGNWSGLGAKTFKKNVSSDLDTGDILAGQISVFRYDGTNMQLVSAPSGVLTSASLASTTVAGIVEEATAAEVAAGTATGGTGARLFINPSNQRLPFFQQRLATSLTTASPNSLDSPFAQGSNTDGSVIWVYESVSVMKRYVKDTNTGTYYVTHSINPALNITKSGSIILIGTFIYLFSSDGTNIIATRFLAADLTGETNMTVPTVVSANGGTVWTDGINAYVVSVGVGTTVKTWTVSGTTFSASASTACADVGSGGYPISSMWDGTTVYLLANGSNFVTSFIIWKLADVLASSKSITTIITGNGTNFFSNTPGNGYIIPIDATKIYVGCMDVIYNATAQYTVHTTLFPFTKP